MELYTLMIRGSMAVEQIEINTKQRDDTAAKEWAANALTYYYPVYYVGYLYKNGDELISTLKADIVVSHTEEGKE